MNRGNMGKQISTAPKSTKVKKMMFGGMASGGSRQPAVMPRPGGAMGSGRPPMVMPRPGMPQAGMVTPGKPGNMGPGGIMQAVPGTPQAGMMEVMRNRRTTGMKKGGAVKGYAKGGMAHRGDGCCMKGKTKGTMK